MTGITSPIALTCLTICLVSALGPVPAGAQCPAPPIVGGAELRPGALVRVVSTELPRLQRHEVLLGAWERDSLVLLPIGRLRRAGTAADPAAGAAPYRISLGSVSRLEVSVLRSRARDARNFGLIGALTGGAIGLGLGALASGLGSDDAIPLGTVAGASIGGLMSAAFGVVVPRARWVSAGCIHGPGFTEPAPQ